MDAHFTPLLLFNKLSGFFFVADLDSDHLVRIDSRTPVFRVIQSLGPTGTPKAHGTLTLKKHVKLGESF